MGLGHWTIVVALIDKAASADLVADLTLVLVENCKNMGHSQCP